MKTTIGGDRLGSGNKQNVSLKTYNRSTHDLGYIWRSSMASGTLVPFMSEVGLPGDSFDIDLNCEVLTLPTIGPLFGSYKVQLDVFTVPIRLYQGLLHMNKLGIGMDMSKVHLPLLELEGYYRNTENDDNVQINPSSIMSYLNIRGLGTRKTNGFVKRNFNAIPFLAYWDIYKNYYANKQEEKGVVIHNNLGISATWTVDKVWIQTEEYGDSWDIYFIQRNLSLLSTATLAIGLKDGAGEPILSTVMITKGLVDTPIQSLWAKTVWDEATNTIYCSEYIGTTSATTYEFKMVEVTAETISSGVLGFKSFSLENIDKMRENLLKAVSTGLPYVIDENEIEPYSLIRKKGDVNAKLTYSIAQTQEGLGLKTYQSDLFNNWISTEWIDGDNGINAVTAVDTSNGEFNIDTLNLANKVYNMLNRIAISGGSYDDWLDAVYSHERSRSIESPMYEGSLIKELAFQEVVGMAASVDQPLGQLAGRGKLTSKNKGGKMKININEPSYVMGIVSITPRIDYSQGNKWDVNLKTMNDLHKPALDEIGYQDLVTDQMAWFDTIADETGNVTYRSAGKQPAWINYMTNVNQVRGDFAIANNSMFMTLNRRYENGGGTIGIEDLTTYVDPTKFNHIFAETALDAQNFWVQISNNITARRKMSAKVIPNL